MNEYDKYHQTTTTESLGLLHLFKSLNTIVKSDLKPVSIKLCERIFYFLVSSTMEGEDLSMCSEYTNTWSVDTSQVRKRLLLMSTKSVTSSETTNTDSIELTDLRYGSLKKMSNF